MRKYFKNTETCLFVCLHLEWVTTRLSDPPTLPTHPKSCLSGSLGNRPVHRSRAQTVVGPVRGWDVQAWRGWRGRGSLRLSNRQGVSNLHGRSGIARWTWGSRPVGRMYLSKNKRYKCMNLCTTKLPINFLTQEGLDEHNAKVNTARRALHDKTVWRLCERIPFLSL